jgi:hypothetical protein
MNKTFRVEATRTHVYEMYVQAKDERAAYEKFDTWMSDDFAPHEIDAHWGWSIVEATDD